MQLPLKLSLSENIVQKSLIIKRLLGLDAECKTINGAVF